MKLPILSRFYILERTAQKTLTQSRNPGSEEVKLEKVSRICRRKRRGAAAVEFAIIAPLFFMMIIGMIEFGRIIMVEQVITNASREGARIGVLDPPPGGTSAPLVTSTVNNYLTAAKISGATITMVPSEPSTAPYGGTVQVTVSVPYSSIGWVRSWFGNSAATFQASTTMRRETIATSQ
jgi:Flp pilus assembly protein TadG